MGQLPVIVPKCKLYHDHFQQCVNYGFMYNKKRKKWWMVWPPPRARQKFIYRSNLSFRNKKSDKING